MKMERRIGVVFFVFTLHNVRNQNFKPKGEREAKNMNKKVLRY